MTEQNDWIDIECNSQAALDLLEASIDPAAVKAIKHIIKINHISIVKLNKCMKEKG